MNLLMIGSGKGSWTMRGQQLGAALGARVTSAPSAVDYGWSDVVVLVKRALLNHGEAARRSGKPIVWDALDFWSQPAQNRLDEAAAIATLFAHAKTIRPAVIVCATKAMARAVGGEYLPHHSWAGLVPTPARAQVQTVAYQGGEVYLGKWRAELERLCAARGWAFVVNPPDLSAVDVIVAFRDGIYDGWICREWKSGVKVVNAMAAGRPFISQASAAVRELQPAGAVVETADELSDAFDLWSSLELRCNVVEGAVALPVEAVAVQYRQILQQVGVPCAAN